MDESTVKELDALTGPLATLIATLPLAEQVEALNRVRSALHEVSPFQREPVDLVLWVPSGDVRGNAYNPNSVAREEMRLLQISMVEDGFTQPIVACPDAEGYEVVDGFHRSLTGRKGPLARRLHGYLPVTMRPGTLAERIAATVRHNRARGKHQVQGMMGLVARLEAEGVDRAAVARALGMEAEEVLRLTRRVSAAQALAGASYSKAWRAEEDDPAE